MAVCFMRSPSADVVAQFLLMDCDGRSYEPSPRSIPLLYWTSITPLFLGLVILSLCENPPLWYSPIQSDYFRGGRLVAY